MIPPSKIWQSKFMVHLTCQVVGEIFGIVVESEVSVTFEHETQVCHKNRGEE